MSPVKITRYTLAASAAKRWQAQYRDDYRFSDNRTAGDIRARLVALGPSPDPADVVAIAGPSWAADPWCNGCDRAVPVVVQVGQEPDYESSTANLCVDCLRAALDLAVSS